MLRNSRITLCNKVRNLCNFLSLKVVTDRIYVKGICPDQIVLFTIEITIEKVLFFLMYFGSEAPGRKVLCFSHTSHSTPQMPASTINSSKSRSSGGFCRCTIILP